MEIDTSSPRTSRSWLFFIELLVPFLAILLHLSYSNGLSRFIVTREVVPNMPRLAVVGGGLAGLSATVEALRAGAHVILIDKGKLGGNSAKATSGINGAVTRHQFAAGVMNDSISLFLKDIVNSGQGKTDVTLAHSLAARSAAAVEFIEGILGKELSNVGLLGGHSRSRTHRLPVSPGSKVAPIGFLTISSFKGLLADPQWKGRLEILENTNVTDISLVPKKGIDGVDYNWVTSITVTPATNIQADPRLYDVEAVVLASGGFAANPYLVQEFSELAGTCPFTTNGPFATGDLLSIGRKLQFDTVDLDMIQLHPTGFVDPRDPLQREKFLCPEMFRGCGALLLNKQGRRFIHELERRDIVSQGIRQNGDTPTEWNLLSTVSDQQPKIALLMMNRDVRECVGPLSFDFYEARGLIQSFESLEDVTRRLGLPLDIVQEEIQKQFGKSERQFDSSGKIYTSFVTPAVHYTMGGLRINPEAQVMRQGQPIYNLFAAGEVSGGLHGANRLGGNGMLESVVFGRLAGLNAARIVNPIESDPFKAKPIVQMSVRELFGLDEEANFVSLTLSYDSLARYLPMKFGERFRLTVKVGSDDGSEGVETKSTVLVPATSALGSLSFVLPPNIHATAIKALHPGDSVMVERLEQLSDSADASILDASTPTLTIDADSLDLGLAVQFANHFRSRPDRHGRIAIKRGTTDCNAMEEYIRNVSAGHVTISGNSD